VQARELKSVYLKARGNFMKLLIHKCYINPLNLFNQVSAHPRLHAAHGGALSSVESAVISLRRCTRAQVGLIAINVLGQPIGGEKPAPGPTTSSAISAGSGGSRAIASLPPVMGPAAG